jgi:hypothetical protein
VSLGSHVVEAKLQSCACCGCPGGHCHYCVCRTVDTACCTMGLTGLARMVLTVRDDLMGSLPTKDRR